MATNETSTIYKCGYASLGNFAITILFMVLPMHILVIKVLVFNLRFEVPRHIILFSLSVSDCLQILVTAILMAVQKVASFSSDSSICFGVRAAIQFNGAVTVVVSSFTLVSLSFERYIMCFYCYRFHEILTKKRVVFVQVAIWILGFLAGGFVVSSFQHGRENVMFSETGGHFSLVILIVTFTVSAVVVIVQARLFWLSKKKLNRIGPQNDNNNDVGRRRQLKITVISSIVVLAYLISMLPSSCTILVHKFKKKKSPPSLTLQTIVTSMAMVNTLINPVIYGFGIADTRKEIKRELRKFKTFIFEKMGILPEL